VAATGDFFPIYRPQARQNASRSQAWLHRPWPASVAVFFFIFFFWFPGFFVFFFSFLPWKI
jgi:hypothetical protein